MTSLLKIATATLELLEKSTDLTPHNKAINQQLNYFVTKIQSTEHSLVELEALDTFKATGALEKLHKLLAQCEFNMEKFWAKNIVEDTLDFMDYPYKSHYESLVAQEIDFLASFNLKPKSLAFVGSGPLPISPLIYQHELNAQITAIDYSHTANKTAEDFIAKNKINGFNFVTTSSELFDYKNHDLVFVASLIDNKLATIQQIKKTNPHAFIAVRTVTGLNEYLYSPFISKSVDGYKQIGMTGYNKKHINQTLLLKPEML